MKTGQRFWYGLQRKAYVEPYRRAIRREFNPDRGFPRLNVGAARKQLDEFKKACTDLRAVIDLEEFGSYLEGIVFSTSGIGWGFHDYLSDVFYSEYPE